MTPPKGRLIKKTAAQPLSVIRNETFYLEARTTKGILRGMRSISRCGAQHA